MCKSGADPGLIMQGFAWVNGFNLGWYWPAAGPQMTTFVPGPLLRAGGNDVVLLEFLCAPADEAGAHAPATTRAARYQMLIDQPPHISERTCLQYQTQAYTMLCQETSPIAGCTILTPCTLQAQPEPHANLLLHLACSAVRGHAGLPWTTRQCLNALVYCCPLSLLSHKAHFEGEILIDSTRASCNTNTT